MLDKLRSFLSFYHLSSTPALHPRSETIQRCDHLAQEIMFCRQAMKSFSKTFERSPLLQGKRDVKYLDSLNKIDRIFSGISEKHISITDLSIWLSQIAKVINKYRLEHSPKITNAILQKEINRSTQIKVEMLKTKDKHMIFLVLRRENETNPTIYQLWSSDGSVCDSRQISWLTAPETEMQLFNESGVKCYRYGSRALMEFYSNSLQKVVLFQPLFYYKNPSWIKSLQMLSSQEPKASTSQNSAELAQEMMHYAQETILFSSNYLIRYPFRGRRDIFSDDFDRFNQIKSISSYIRDENVSGTNAKDFLSKSVARIAKYRIGNCGQFARVGLQYAIDRATSQRVEMFYVTGGDHVFLVIGRKKDSDPNDTQTWGPDAVICDPWVSSCFPAKLIKEMLPSKVLQHDSFTELAWLEYFDPTKHQLQPEERLYDLLPKQKESSE